MNSFATATIGGFVTRRVHGEHPSRSTATDRATTSPCLGLAVAAGGVLWAGLGSAVLLLLA